MLTLMNILSEVYYFFNAQDDELFTNPPDSNFYDSSSSQFTYPDTGPDTGLYLLGVSAASKDAELHDKTGEVLAKMHSDSGACSSIKILPLQQGDEIQAISQTSGSLRFLGTSLSAVNNAQYLHAVYGTASKHLNMENTPQSIIMMEHSKTGNDLTYDGTTGCIQVMEEGIYLMGLTLSSRGSTFASLSVGDISLGLGDDTEGQGMMTNIAIVELGKGDCILPQLEPLSQLYDEDNWSQIFVTSIPHGTREHAFSYGLSQPIYSQDSKQVRFDVPILQNSDFQQTSGTFVIQDEMFNPRRFYLVFVNAFLASGTISLELGDTQGG